MIQKVLKIGSSAAVTIPHKLLEALGLKIGDRVAIEINSKPAVIIAPARPIRVKKELKEWTEKFITRYQSALEALAKK